MQNFKMMGLPEKGGQVGGERIDKLLPLWAVVPLEPV